MKLKNLFTINAVITFSFGVGLLAAPATILNLFTGLMPDALGIHIARELGVLVLAFSLISWMVRSAEPSKATNALVMGLALAYPVLAILAAISTLNGTLAPTYWVNVFLFTILAIGFWVMGKPSLRA